MDPDHIELPGSFQENRAHVPCFCNVQPSQATTNTVSGKEGWFTALYTQHLLDSQSFEFEICISLNMPLIRCTDVFFQGRLPRHIIFPSEKTRPESWPVRQLRLGSCHYPTAATKCNEQPSQAAAIPITHLVY